MLAACSKLERDIIPIVTTVIGRAGRATLPHCSGCEFLTVGAAIHGATRQAWRDGSTRGTGVAPSQSAAKELGVASSDSVTKRLRAARRSAAPAARDRDHAEERPESKRGDWLSRKQRDWQCGEQLAAITTMETDSARANHDGHESNTATRQRQQLQIDCGYHLRGRSRSQGNGGHNIVSTLSHSCDITED